MEGRAVRASCSVGPLLQRLGACARVEVEFRFFGDTFRDGERVLIFNSQGSHVPDASSSGFCTVFSNFLAYIVVESNDPDSDHPPEG